MPSATRRIPRADTSRVVVLSRMRSNRVALWVLSERLINSLGAVYTEPDVRGVQLLWECIDPPDPLCMRMPALFSEKSLFHEGVCRADSAFGMWTADAGGFCMLVRGKYACRTTGTCECAPASQVDAMHSIYMLVMSGIPSPPHVRFVVCVYDVSYVTTASRGSAETEGTMYPFRCETPYSAQ